MVTMKSLKNVMKKLLVLTLPSLIIAIFCLEVLVRLTWDDKKGEPGLKLAHPTRQYVFKPNYTGYLEKQPLKINNLGFRDDNDYAIEKGDKVFRIMILGDSVTFGYGIKFSETWPYIFQKRLEEWDPETNWQVWNMGFPGYNIRQKLVVLEEDGPLYEPDLVIVGFFEADSYDPNYDYRSELEIRILSFFKQHFYLFHSIKHIWHVLSSKYESGKTGAQIEQARLNIPDIEIPLFDASNFKFKHGLPSSPRPPKSTRLLKIPEGPDVPRSCWHIWECPANALTEIEKFQKYHRDGIYNIAFFLNIGADIFYDGFGDGKYFGDGMYNDVNNWLLKVLGKETPVVSSYDAWFSYNPSEIPWAHGHSRGASNHIKADILFDFISTEVIKDKPNW